MSGYFQLLLAASCSFVASLLHIAIVFGGPAWYRFFGAGEGMAKLSKSGSYYPTVIKLIIAAVLAVFGLYALSGAGVGPRLPLLRTALIVITLVYLGRGLAGLIAPFISSHPSITQNSVSFWVISSTVCTAFGLFYLLGTINSWKSLSVPAMAH